MATVATAVIASTTVVPYHVLDVKAASFTDIKKGTFYYEAVVSLAGKGVIDGFKDGTFKPSQNTTRGQAAAMIARALKLEDKDVKDPGFSDVHKDAYYYKSVAALVEKKIVSGVTSDSFKPDRLITRAEMSKMIANAFELKESKTSASKFKDVPANSWYAGFVGALLENDVTKGMTTTTFAPSQYVDRAQIATFIYRAEQNKPLSNVIENVTDSTVKIDGQSYKVAESLKGLFQSSNSTILKDARIAFKQDNGTITSVYGLEITASGKAAAAGQSETSGHLILDGKGAVINGNVKITGDYVTLKNLTVKENFTIGSAVQNSFFSDKLVVEGKTILADDVKSTVSTASMTSASGNISKAKVVFSNSTLKVIEVNKANVALESKGTTTLIEIKVTKNVNISGDKTALIPKITLQIGAKNVGINASVQNLIIDSGDGTTITGNTTFEHVKILNSGSVNLNTTGEIKILESTNKDAKITIKEGTKVTNVLILEGLKISDVIQNYNSVKENIGEVTLPPVVTPPAGGGGPMPSDKTAPTLESATLTIGGKAITGTDKGGVWEVSLKNLADTDMFTDIHLDSSEEGTASITYSGVTKQATLDEDGKGSFNVKQMLGALDGGLPGVSVGTLKSRMGGSGSTTLTGSIKDKSGNSNPITIKITKN